MTPRFASAEDCPDARTHTPVPFGYVERSEWMERKAKTHTQHRCRTCGFFAIWKRKR